LAGNLQRAGSLSPQKSLIVGGLSQQKTARRPLFFAVFRCFRLNGTLQTLTAFTRQRLRQRPILEQATILQTICHLIMLIQPPSTDLHSVNCPAEKPAHKGSSRHRDRTPATFDAPLFGQYFISAT
jgi:hypothetical protein